MSGKVELQRIHDKIQSEIVEMREVATKLCPLFKRQDKISYDAYMDPAQEPAVYEILEEVIHTRDKLQEFRGSLIDLIDKFLQMAEESKAEQVGLQQLIKCYTLFREDIDMATMLVNSFDKDRGTRVVDALDEKVIQKLNAAMDKLQFN